MALGKGGRAGRESSWQGHGLGWVEVVTAGGWGHRGTRTEGTLEEETGMRMRKWQAGHRAGARRTKTAEGERCAMGTREGTGENRPYPHKEYNLYFSC